MTIRHEHDRPESRRRLGLTRPLEIENSHSQVRRNGRWPTLLHRRPRRREAKLGAQKIQIAVSYGGNVEVGLQPCRRWPLAPFSATAPENAVTGAEKSNQAAGHEVRRPRRQAL